MSNISVRPTAAAAATDVECNVRTADVEWNVWPPATDAKCNFGTAAGNIYPFV